MNNIVWTAVSAAVLSVISIFMSTSNPSLSLAIGLAAITNAVLATRE
jgi:hypothetical protein